MPIIIKKFVGETLVDVAVMPKKKSLQHAVSFTLDLEYRISNIPKYISLTPKLMSVETGCTIYVYNFDNLETTKYKGVGGGCIILAYEGGFYGVISEYSDIDTGYKCLYSKYDGIVSMMDEMMCV